MKAIIYAVVTVVLTGGVGTRGVMAQTIPLDRLPQFSRDLTPPNAQDFFRAGQAQMEQEIRWLLQQRLAHLTDILQVQSVIVPQGQNTSPPVVISQPKPAQRSPG